MKWGTSDDAASGHAVQGGYGLSDIRFGWQQHAAMVVCECCSKGSSAPQKSHALVAQISTIMQCCPWQAAANACAPHTRVGLCVSYLKLPCAASASPLSLRKAGCRSDTSRLSACKAAASIRYAWSHVTKQGELVLSVAVAVATQQQGELILLVAVAVATQQLDIPLPHIISLPLRQVQALLHCQHSIT